MNNRGITARIGTTLGGKRALYGGILLVVLALLVPHGGASMGLLSIFSGVSNLFTNLNAAHLLFFQVAGNVTVAQNTTSPTTVNTTTTVTSTILPPPVLNQTANNTTTSTNSTATNTTSNSTTTTPPTSLNSTTTNPPPTTTQLTNQSTPLTIQDPYAVINNVRKTNDTVTKGHVIKITINDNGASGGTQPYTYQWLESYDNSTLAPALDCGAGNSPSVGAVTPCIIVTTPQNFSKGTYVFKLEVTDAAGQTAIDSPSGGFVLIITNLTLSTNLIINSGSSTAIGTATGGSGTYDLTWSVNGTLANGTPINTCSVLQSPQNTTGTSSLLLTDGTIYTCLNGANGGSITLSDGIYGITFTATDAANLTDSNSSVATLDVDWPSGIFANRTLTSTGQPVTLTVEWHDPEPSYSVILFQSSSTSSCSKTGTFSETNSITSKISPPNYYDGQDYYNSTDFFVSPTSSVNYCAYVRYYDSKTIQNSGTLVANESTTVPAAVSLDVTPALTATLIANKTTINTGQKVHFTNTTSGGTGSNQYTLTFNNSVGVTHGSDGIYTFTNAGKYNATLTVIDVSGEVATSSVIITVKSTIKTVLIANWTTISAGQWVHFTNATTGGTGNNQFTQQVSCSPNVGAYSVGSNNKILFTQANTCTVTLTVKDQSGNTNSSSNTITITPPLKDTLTANRTAVSPDQKIAFTNTTSGGTGNVQYSYNTNCSTSGGTYKQSGNIFNFTQAGTCTVTLDVSDLTGETNQSSVIVTITPPLEIKLAANRTDIVDGNKVLFINTTMGGTGSNVWTYSVNNSIGVVQSGNKFTFNNAGWYKGNSKCNRPDARKEYIIYKHICKRDSSAQSDNDSLPWKRKDRNTNIQQGSGSY